MLIRSGEALGVGWSRNMLYSGFSILHRSVVRRQTGFAARITRTLCRLKPVSEPNLIEIPVTLIHDKGHTDTGTFQYADEYDNAFNLHLFFGGEVLSTHGNDYFHSFCKLRRKLEGRGWRPLCEGARLDVYPSRMCRDMGRGLVAYTITLGSAEVGKAHVFDAAPDVKPATVDEQRAFFDEWLKSRGIL